AGRRGGQAPRPAGGRLRGRLHAAPAEPGQGRPDQLDPDRQGARGAEGHRRQGADEGQAGGAEADVRRAGAAEPQGGGGLRRARQGGEGRRDAAAGLGDLGRDGGGEASYGGG